MNCLQDHNRDGILQFRGEAVSTWNICCLTRPEFCLLCKYIEDWKGIFQKADKDSSGLIGLCHPILSMSATELFYKTGTSFPESFGNGLLRSLIRTQSAWLRENMVSRPILVFRLRLTISQSSSTIRRFGTSNRHSSWSFHTCMQCRAKANTPFWRLRALCIMRSPKWLSIIRKGADIGGKVTLSFEQFIQVGASWLPFLE